MLCVLIIHIIIYEVCEYKQVICAARVLAFTLLRTNNLVLCTLY